jgi:hypothetical protein
LPFYMKTHTVHPAPSAHFDAVLVEKLRPLTMPVDPAAGAIRIGLAGADGAMYRVIETSSVVEAVHVFEALNDLGYVPHPRRHSGAGVTRLFTL